MNIQAYNSYLATRSVTDETASDSIKSAATAYATTYDWYINNQRVTPENAEIAAGVFVNKYALRDTSDIVLEMTPEDMWHRLANSLAKTEVETNKVSTKTEAEWADEFYETFKDFKYVLGGSGLAATGNDYIKSSSSNCMVYDSSKHGDSLEGIFETIKNLGTIFKYRGGSGVDISHLRPRDARVNNSARTSTGAASFMDLFSQAGAVVGQGGRRSAQMISIRVDHPDILEFIAQKTDQDKQWFLKELEEAGIDLNDWKYSSIASRLKSTTNANVTVKLTDAFIDAVETDSDYTLWYDFPVDSTYAPIRTTIKARQVWDALIAGATKAAEPGMFNWDHIVRESVADCYAGRHDRDVVIKGIKKTVSVNTATITSNPCISATTLIATVTGPRSIGELAVLGDDVLVYCTDHTGNVHIRPMRRPRLTNPSAEVYEVTFNTGDTLVCTGNHRLQLHGGIQVRVADINVGSGLPIPCYSTQQAVTIKDTTLTKDPFGYVQRTCEVCNKDYDVPYETREVSVCADRGCREKYRNNLSAKYAENAVHSEVYPASPFILVTNVTCLTEPQPVYNGTVDDFHTYCIYLWKGDTHVATPQCGEILMNEDTCCIGSFFLPQFVKNPWTADAKFDFDMFSKYIRTGTRIQDNVKEQDIDKLPLEVYKASAVLLRRLGIGCHGLGDTLASLGLKYDSPEAITTAGTIFEALKNTTYDESVNLGIEKGVFEMWDWEKEKNSAFLNRLDPAVLERIKQHGRRNVMLNTCAPTGSLSILSRNCSSGIEPIFMKSYVRAIKRSGTDEVDSHTIYHQAVKDCKDAGGDTSVFVTAGQIDGYKRVEMQAAIQKHIDHSISSTINLPAGTTEEYVSGLYLHAFKSGCKGLTVYVDGSRGGVLVDANKKPKTPVATGPIERPKTTAVDIHKTKYKDKTYMVLVGKLEDGTPIEVFGGEEDGLSLPTKYHKATLTKKSRGHYSLTVQLSADEDDILKISDISARFPAADVITMCRMTSLSLRNRVPVSEIVTQLVKSADNMFSSPAVFARILKQYIPAEELVAKHKGEPCPVCGAEMEIRAEGGCVIKKCKSCDHFDSKCS